RAERANPQLLRLRARERTAHRQAEPASLTRRRPRSRGVTRRQRVALHAERRHRNGHRDGRHRSQPLSAFEARKHKAEPISPSARFPPISPQRKLTQSTSTALPPTRVTTRSWTPAGTLLAPALAVFHSA